VRDLIAELNQQKTDYSATPGGFPLIPRETLERMIGDQGVLAAGPIASGRDYSTEFLLESPGA